MQIFDLVFLCGRMVCRLHEFTEWGQGQVMEQVLRYQPASDEEAIDILVSLIAFGRG